MKIARSERHQQLEYRLLQRGVRVLLQGFTVGFGGFGVLFVFFNPLDLGGLLGNFLAFALVISVRGV